MTEKFGKDAFGWIFDFMQVQNLNLKLEYNINDIQFFENNEGPRIWIEM